MVRKQMIGWFCYDTEEQYNEFKEIFTDADKLPKTYLAWKLWTDQSIRFEESLGASVTKIYPTNSVEFIEFCNRHHIPLNFEGRKTYVESKLYGEIPNIC